MRNVFTILMIMLTAIFSNYSAQSGTVTNSPNTSNESGLRLSVRAGYDVPAFGNNTPYIDYKGGLEAGASLDYYWHWIGIGADFNYISNKPKNTYPTADIYLKGSMLSSFTINESKINRTFLGIGPSFKYQKNYKNSWEFKLRGGISTIKGGRTELVGNFAPNPPTLLNFHAGYDAKNVLSGKASLQYSHFFSQNFGLTLGAYYLQHFNVKELVDPTLGIAAGYQPFTNRSGSVANGADGGFTIDPQGGFLAREVACDCEIHSAGVFAGLVFTFGGKKAADACPVCGKVHYPFCCATCGCDVTITARDKFTKELLDNTDVALVDDKGNTAQTGTTNSFGVVVFKNVQPDNYTVRGKLHDVALSENIITKGEFDKCKTEGEAIQKEILYPDENFIINGKVVICNTNMPINDVQVTLKNNQIAVQKTTNSNSKGEFMFHAAQNVNYTIYGKKGSFLSQEETLLTKDYDRNKTLFIKLEVCMDPADCGKAINLKNIQYDLDKYFIRDSAKPELNRLVRFMNDNPGLKVELSSHTDSRSSDAYNKTLSQNRANAAVDYLVSQGISRDRLIGIGYGESRLLNKCADGVPCTEAEHQMNRRTEMKVICP